MDFNKMRMILKLHPVPFLSWVQLQNLSRRFVGYQLRGSIRDCYSLLNVTDSSSDDEVRDAYLKLAKVYHPDSGTASADPRKFNQVQEAYKAIKVLAHLHNNGKIGFFKLICTVRWVFLLG